MEIEVKGHSGCKIDIVREGNELFVNKSTCDPKYVERLMLQAAKQQRASEREYQHIRVPRIYETLKSPDECSIKMEYVYSKNFIEYFESAGFEQINYFVIALERFVEKELASSPIVEVNSSVVVDKYDDVKARILHSEYTCNDGEISDILSACDKVIGIATGGGNLTMPVGICHGDLTFSNILFNGNNYYLIDFLDSFVESPLLDIVKIRQDSRHLWSQLMYVHAYDRIRLQIICKKIDKEIDHHFRQYEWYSRYYDMFQLLNLLRILQYAHEEKVIGYLKVELQKCLS